MTRSICILMAAGACGVGHDGTTPVETPNKLGITELVIEQTTEADAFVVAGWSGDEEVARFALHLGLIEGLGAAGPELGSEMIIDVGGVRSRNISREMSLFRLDGATSRELAFAQIPEVSHALRAVNVMVPAAIGERAYTYGQCLGDMLLNNQTARQCEFNWGPGFQGHTVFVNASNVGILRYMNGPVGGGTAYGCKASDGQSSCAGRSCYYGPYGFSTPNMATGAFYRIEPDDGGEDTWGGTGKAIRVGYATDYGTETYFDDVSNGANPAGGDCCGNGGGPCNAGGSTPACSSCTATNVPLSPGYWDY